MATTRLRRTFAYPSSDEDEETLETGLDASEILHTLHTHDTSSTRTYTLLLLVFPLAPAVMHVPLLVQPKSFVPAMLALVSLLASAFVLYFCALPPVGVGGGGGGGGGGGKEEAAGKKVGRAKGKRKGGYALNLGSSSSSSSSQDAGHQRLAVPYVSEDVAEMLRMYVVPGNAAVCGLLVVLELLRGRTWSEGFMIGGGYLPGLVMSVVMWARRELRVVDLGELEKLRVGSGGI